MAGNYSKKQAPSASDYGEEIRLLKKKGPQRLYYIWGEESYLSSQLLIALKNVCLPEGEDDFSFRRINGPEIDVKELRGAVDALPFLSERTFVEIHDAVISSDAADAAIDVLSDIPEHCTVVFIYDSEYKPDNRLKFTKFLKASGREIMFSRQNEGKLGSWIVRRFDACGKKVDPDAVMRLMFVSGTLMSRLIPEIEKIASYAKGERVTVSDINAVASRIPEANVFELASLISQRQFNSASALLGELLYDRSNEPIALLAILGNQMRRLYAARLVIEAGKGADELVSLGIVKNIYAAKNDISAARGFSAKQLSYAVRLCAENDYRMKRTASDEMAGILKETVMCIAAGMGNA